MAKYKAIKRGFHESIREVGDVFEYEGVPGLWMELVEEKSEAKAETKPEKKAEQKKHAPEKAHVSEK